MPIKSAMTKSSYNYANDDIAEFNWSADAFVLGHAGNVGGFGGFPPTAGYYIEGTQGADTLYGSQLADDIYGLDGDDVLYGQDGNDGLYGGRGNDILHGGAGADRMDGGEGVDLVSYSGSSAVTVDLRDRGFNGDAEGDTYVGIENVAGSSFGDVLLGNAGDNAFWGGAGNDQMFGDFGNDTLNGDAGHDHLDGGFGNDVLVGGTGNDVLIGGGGSDMFVFRPSSGADTIVDFQRGVDKIGLETRGPWERGPDLFSDPFGRDDELASGRFNSDGTWSGTGLDGADKVIYLTNTNQLISVEQVTGVNGHWTVFGESLLATLNVDVSTSDFMLL